MVDEYTFYKNCTFGKMWVCSSKCALQCGAKIRYDNDHVKPCNLDHNHPPPKYFITKDGEYVKC